MATVAQRNEIKRQKARLEALQKEEESEREQARARARERVVQDFERSQTGLGGSKLKQADNGKKEEEGNREFVVTRPQSF
jgi:nitric oxide synthase-interacting protein